jgi:hypothetical protein
LVVKPYLYSPEVAFSSILSSFGIGVGYFHCKFISKQLHINGLFRPVLYNVAFLTQAV